MPRWSDRFRRPIVIRQVAYPAFVSASNQSDAVAKLAPGTIVAIIPADIVKSFKLLCPCGCKTVVSINVQRGAGKAWRFHIDEQSGLSIWPSVWLDIGCESHFILQDNVALLLGPGPVRQ